MKNEKYRASRTVYPAGRAETRGSSGHVPLYDYCSISGYLSLPGLGFAAIQVGEKVTENQAKIFGLVAKNPVVTSSEMSKEIGISERKTKENISKLKRKGFLKRIGPDKGGHWEVARKKGRATRYILSRRIGGRIKERG